MCASLPGTELREGKPNILTVLRRAWIPLVLVVVLLLGAFTVTRLRGMFGSHQTPTYAGSMSDDSHVSDPKRVVYEIWGVPGATADINYLDDRGTPHQITGAALPWSVEILSNSPALAGNILAQGNGNHIGCRITADDVVKVEKTASGTSAYVYCLAKAA